MADYCLYSKFVYHIPNLQMQLHQAEGYKQALVDLEKEEKETIKKQNASTN